MYFLRKSADPNYKLLIMAQEDNLRALGKIIDFIRAVSILFVIIHIYWFCYEMVTKQTLDIEVVDKILMNFTGQQVCFHHRFTPSCLPTFCWLCPVLVPGA